jgi:hypothetical protein
MEAQQLLPKVQDVISIIQPDHMAELFQYNKDKSKLYYYLSRWMKRLTLEEELHWIADDIMLTSVKIHNLVWITVTVEKEHSRYTMERLKNAMSRAFGWVLYSDG